MITARSEGFSLPLRLSGQGTPMIFLHGLGSDSRDSRRDLGDLPGVRLALADQRGHGSARPAVRAGEFGLDALVGDLAAMSAALGWPHPIVAGGSMGAAVALRYAVTRPGDSQALVLVAPALAAERPAAAGLIAGVADRIDAVGLDQAVAEIRSSQPEAAPDGMEPWLRQDGASLVAAMRAVQSWRPITSLAELSAIGVPTVLVGIRDDPLHPVELAEQMHAHLRSSLEILPSPGAARRPGAIGAAVLRGLHRLGVV
jgi:pimeloyl-ACP methyl ester carboxylesterase